ncbi:hypothetical protein KR222_008334 [Zaprionus bogoriensis]|nr:hypothetical protein KR222_008334 [Zaprionus bogoriensis]
MWQQVRIRVIYLLIVLAGSARATKFIFHTETERVFSECIDPPDGEVVDMNGLVDTSEMEFELTSSDTIAISGNITLVWSINPSDRVEAYFGLFKFDRGEWQKTLFSMNVKDFCKVLYDERQHWYKYWTQYVVNADEVKSKCFNVPGTMLRHRPFDTDMTTELPGLSLEGKHKVIGIFRAFDEHRNQQGPTVCFEILGYIEQL